MLWKENDKERGGGGWGNPAGQYLKAASCCLFSFHFLYSYLFFLYFFVVFFFCPALIFHFSFFFHLLFLFFWCYPGDHWSNCCACHALRPPRAQRTLKSRPGSRPSTNCVAVTVPIPMPIAIPELGPVLPSSLNHFPREKREKLGHISSFCLAHRIEYGEGANVFFTIVKYFFILCCAFFIAFFLSAAIKVVHFIVATDFRGTTQHPVQASTGCAALRICPLTLWINFNFPNAMHSLAY